MSSKFYIQSVVRITSDAIWKNGVPMDISACEGNWLTQIYRSLDIQYPKFFKMDNLCKSGFLAAEIVMQSAHLEPSVEKRDWSVLVFNRSGSLDNDQHYQETIQNKDNFYPSPAVFVYTLSNIVTGEIAIRNKIMGESCSYIQENFSATALYETSLMSLSKEKEINHILIGWVEYLDNQCDVLMFHVNNTSDGSLCEWAEENIVRFHHQ